MIEFNDFGRSRLFDIDPTATPEERAEHEQWLAERPSIRCRLDPFVTYRIKSTGQVCRIVSFFESGQLGVYAEHPVLGACSGVKVVGIEPTDLEPWPADEIPPKRELFMVSGTHEVTEVSSENGTVTIERK